MEAQRQMKVSIISHTGAPRPSAPRPRIDPPPRENPGGTTFRVLEVEQRDGGEWKPEWDELGRSCGGRVAESATARYDVSRSTKSARSSASSAQLIELRFQNVQLVGPTLQQIW